MDNQNTNSDLNNQKYKTVKITENINGKAIKIGQGGFGKVYKVVKYNDKSELKSESSAIKNIVPFAQKHTHVFERDGNLIGQNLKEISLGYKYLNHENLQKFQYIMVNEKDFYDSKYIINMLLADMSFYDLIQSKLSKDNRILFFFPILKQIIKGLSYIHANLINHCDIKPENILIYGDKKLLNNLSDYLKSATFQISDYSSINIEYNNTMDNTSTLHYRSPELFIKVDKKFKKSIKETFGPYNDIWSVALTMLEFLTGTNIISKLYKKSMKIREKEFLSRFFNCMKSLDISMVLKNNGYDINNCHVKNIINILELMLMKKIKERINIYNLSIFIDHYIIKNKKIYIYNNFTDTNLYENIPLLNEVIEYQDDIKSECINIELRKNAIVKLYDFLKIDEYSDPNDNQYLPLSLSLFDRLLSKNIFKNNTLLTEFMYFKTLLECYYIASRYLLSDIDILFLTEFLNIDMELIHMDILEILKQMDYDIYRPTVLTFLNNQNEDIYHSKYIIDSSIYFYCDIYEIKTNYRKSVEYINELIYNESLLSEHNILNLNLNDKDIDVDFSKCSKPSLKRDDYDFSKLYD
jgi:serine/threonine protein kinase